MGQVHLKALPLSMAKENNGLDSLELPTAVQEKLTEVGLCDTSELKLLASDFVDRPEVFSSLLQSDFGLDPMSAHRTRAAVMNVMSIHQTPWNGAKLSQTEDRNLSLDSKNDLQRSGSSFSPSESKRGDEAPGDVGAGTRPLYKSVVVNDKAKRRKAAADEKHDYGLHVNCHDLHPILADELDDFFTFMTRPSTGSQESPIKPATANIYMRHARQFLGWFLSQHEKGSKFDKTNASIFEIVPNKEKESANCLLDFILWLRTNRSISVSYEANILRGLTKLTKFRFAEQSQADPSYGEKSFDDIPVVRELRKLHRDANKRQTLAPRSSDENRKWLSWPEYLQVIEKLKGDLLRLVDSEASASEAKTDANQSFTTSQRRIATMYQHFLILSVFACVPDRQRTIRELELNRSFIHDEQNEVWVIKHAPDDYKTGRTVSFKCEHRMSDDVLVSA